MDMWKSGLDLDGTFEHMGNGRYSIGRDLKEMNASFFCLDSKVLWF